MEASAIDQVLAYLNEKFPSDEVIKSSTALRDTVLSDSIKVLDLVVYLEEQFGVELTRRDVLTHFETAEQIAALIERRGAN